MKQNLQRSILLIVIASFLAFTAGAQTLPTAATFVGEKLEFEGKVSKIIQGMAVADLTFDYEQVGDTYVIRSHANSKGSLAKLFRFSFVQDYETTIDPATMNVLATKKHDVQRDRIRESIANFDYKERRVVFIETDPNDRTRPPRRIASEIGDLMNDLVSGIYRIRTMPIEVGKTIRLPISDSGLTYTIPVRIAAREKQKTTLGKIWCFRLEPLIFGPGRLIESKGSMVIWLADDATRTPVRSVIKIPVGKFDVRLQSVSRSRA